jgi:hypothetical protein
MTVEVSPLNVLGGAGSPPVTHFEDTFNRAGGQLGGNWIQTISASTPTINPIDAATFSIGTAADLAQAMICSVVGTINPGMTYPSGLLAAPIYMSNFGRSQFSEWQMVRMDRVGANDAFGGPSVLLKNDGQQAIGNEKQGLNGYYILVFASDKSYQLNRGNGFVATNLTSGAAATFTANDIIRLEARINPSDVTLKVVKNGATINTFVDNTAGRMLLGSPGWFGQQFDNTGGGSMTNQWRNFRGGLL